MKKNLMLGVTLARIAKKQFPSLSNVPDGVLVERVTGRAVGVIPAYERILNRKMSLLIRDPDSLGSPQYLRSSMGIIGSVLVDDAAGYRMIARLILSLDVSRPGNIQSVANALTELAETSASISTRTSAIDHARLLLFQLRYDERDRLGARLQEQEDKIKGHPQSQDIEEKKDGQESAREVQGTATKSAEQPLLPPLDLEGGPLVRKRRMEVQLPEDNPAGQGPEAQAGKTVPNIATKKGRPEMPQEPDDLAAVAGEIDHDPDSSPTDPIGQEPPVAIRDSVFLDLHEALRKDIKELFRKIQDSRSIYDSQSAHYWSLVKRCNEETYGNQVDGKRIQIAYYMQKKAYDTLASFENAYQSKLENLSRESGINIDAVEKSLLGEFYFKEIEYRLSKARQMILSAREQGDDGALRAAEQNAWKLERIIQAMEDATCTQDGMVKTESPAPAETFIPSLNQEQQEKEAVEELMKTRALNQEGKRLEEIINAGATIHPSYHYAMEARLAQRAKYKRALDKLSIEYNNASFERLHDLIEKRERYDQAVLAVYTAFGPDISRGMQFNQILSLGEAVLSSGRYNGTPDQSKDRIAADFFHASFELNHARELLFYEPLQSITLDNGTIELRTPAINIRNTVWCFSDMVEHIQSKPPTPEQLAELIDLRQGQEHRENKILNVTMWGIMSYRFGNGNRSRKSPIVVTVPKDLALMQGDGVYTSSHYIAIRHNPDLTADDRSAIIAHEQAHYLAALNGGLGEVTEDGKMDMRWQVGIRKMNGATWLHEGLTEMLTQNAIRENGVSSRKVGYPREVIVCLYLEKLVGRDLLEKAYLSGDFTKVANKLDSELGHGTFEELLMKRMTFMADIFITKAMGELGIDHRSWEGGQIFMIARNQLREN